MVDKNRIIPGVLILFFLIFFYFFELDLLLIVILTICCFYDLYKSKFLNILYLFFFFGIQVIIFYLFDYLYLSHLIYLILFFISFMFIFLIKKYEEIFFIFLILIFLSCSFELIITDRNTFYLLIFISFINDTSAYIAGNFFKGPLIIKSISPKKTWSGTIISFIISSSLLIYLNFGIIISIIISSLFFLGDIFFSYFKRLKGIKDFSNLLKGHGGILDRIDSIFFIFLLIIFQNNYLYNKI